MAEIRQTFSRGIQEEDVWGAADLLLHEGLRPTIERVRQKIGRGSPNTVSPMLERWFASLGERLVGSTAGSASGRPAGNDPDGMPIGVRNAARLLWETARREAEEVQRGELESVRSELQVREDALVEAQAALAQREDAFAQARVSLDSALTSSQQARETLELQLAEQATEGHRLRAAMEQEIARLNALLQEAHAGKEVLRKEHAAALATRERDLRDAEARHAAQEKRMLAEVDRARQAAKQFEADLTKEGQRRMRGEEAAAQLLHAERQALRDAEQTAQQAERALRDQLAAQGIALAQKESHGAALQQRLDDLHQQLSGEKKSHDATRALLAGALAAARKPGAARKPPGRGQP